MMRSVSLPSPDRSGGLVLGSPRISDANHLGTDERIRQVRCLPHSRPVLNKTRFSAKYSPSSCALKLTTKIKLLAHYKIRRDVEALKSRWLTAATARMARL